MLVFLAIPVLVSGVSGLLWAYAPEATLSLRLNEAMFNLVAKLIVADLPDALDIIHPDAVEEILAGVLRFVLAPVGVMMILAAGMMGRDSEIADMTGESGSFDSG
ncbi:MAG: hypothetical protein ACI9QQ_002635, partial [Myxococcota bacterium]